MIGCTQSICKLLHLEPWHLRVLVSKALCLSRLHKDELSYQNQLFGFEVDSLSNVPSNNPKVAAVHSEKPLDKLIYNLHERKTSKYKKTALAGSLELQKPIRNSPNIQVRKTRASMPEDKDCSTDIEKLLRLGQVTEAVASLQKYASATRYPSRKTLLHVAAALSSAGNVDGIEKVGNICQRAFPKEFAWQMGYQHYKAEALRNMAQYQESIKLFKDLTLHYPLQRKKISNMFRFLVQDLVQKQLQPELEMVVESVDICASNGIYHPGASAWFEMFTSEWSYARYLCTQLPHQHKDMKLFIEGKVDSVVRKAIQHNSTDMMQDFVDLIMCLDMASQMSKAFSALMEIHCNNSNIVGAMETFRHVHSEGIVLYGSTCQRFMLLLAKYQCQTPLHLLRMKYNISNVYSPPKFLF